MEKKNGFDGFAEIINEIVELHAKKSHDYGSDEDPLANIRDSEQFGIPAWVGAIVRGNDKMKRIKKFVKSGKLENESVEDSLLDLAVYSIISLQLYRESRIEKINEEIRQEYLGKDYQNISGVYVCQPEPGAKRLEEIIYQDPCDVYKQEGV